MSKKVSSAENQQGSQFDPSETIRRAPPKFCKAKIMAGEDIVHAS